MDPQIAEALTRLAESQEKIAGSLDKMNSAPLVENPVVSNVKTV